MEKAEQKIQETVQKMQGTVQKMQDMAQKIEEADAVLLGIGAEFTEKKAERAEILNAYNHLANLVQGKPWFAVTVNTDDLIYQSKLNDFFIVAPCGSESAGNVITMDTYDESSYLPQWQFYTNWLASTLGKKLCMLELGVGFEYPTVIRFPFEKTALYHQKSVLIRVHSSLAMVPEEVAERSICIRQNPVEFVNEMNIYTK
ncbi:MAG: hypothetical protein Q4C50_04330 [Eubacteriales bacterium]|nr:hypothetical protein [Eubacteriales bacterium]